MGPTDTDDFELGHKLLIERDTFRSMVRRFSFVCFITGVTLYCVGTVIAQHDVVVAAAIHTIIPLAVCLAVTSINDNGNVWQSGKRFWLQTHKLCVSLFCTLLSFDLGVLCAAIGT